MPITEEIFVCVEIAQRTTAQTVLCNPLCLHFAGQKMLDQYFCFNEDNMLHIKNTKMC